MDACDCVRTGGGVEGWRRWSEGEEEDVWSAADNAEGDAMLRSDSLRPFASEFGFAVRTNWSSKKVGDVTVAIVFGVTRACGSEPEGCDAETCA